MAINLDAGQVLSPARGRDFCRGCSGKNLFSALDLGELPLANELQKTPNEHVEKFPLHLRICEECGLGQVADVVTPERIFVDYRCRFLVPSLLDSRVFLNSREGEGYPIPKHTLRLF